MKRKKKPVKPKECTHGSIGCGCPIRCKASKPRTGLDIEAVISLIEAHQCGYDCYGPVSYSSQVERNGSCKYVISYDIRSMFRDN